MKIRFVYFLTGALLCGFVLLFFQMTQASPAAPNPGHELSCHIISVTSPAYGVGVSVTCDYGTLTGGGCYTGANLGSFRGNYPDGVSWECLPTEGTSPSHAVIARAICCEAI